MSLTRTLLMPTITEVYVNNAETLPLSSPHPPQAHTCSQMVLCSSQWFVSVTRIHLNYCLCVACGMGRVGPCCDGPPDWSLSVVQEPITELHLTAPTTESNQWMLLRAPWGPGSQWLIFSGPLRMSGRVCECEWAWTAPRPCLLTAQHTHTASHREAT